MTHDAWYVIGCLVNNYFHYSYMFYEDMVEHPEGLVSVKDE